MSAKISLTVGKMVGTLFSERPYGPQFASKKCMVSSFFTGLTVFTGYSGSSGITG
jgi:hypothetical protein